MIQYREASLEDAEAIATLHADSWRRHYRGAYADAFLDGDHLLPDRRQLWHARLATPAHAVAILAEDESTLCGFVHVILDEDEHWGSLLDNRHVTVNRQRAAIGQALLGRAGEAAAAGAFSRSLYLGVLEQNIRAKRFYRTCAGVFMDLSPVPPPGGIEGRLNGASWDSGFGGPKSPASRAVDKRTGDGLPLHWRSCRLRPR